MAWPQKMRGGILGVIGFLLSPLSWWNDAFINLPLAVGFGWVVALVYRPAFEPAVVVGYWLTNIAGLMLLHKGIAAVATDAKAPYTWRSFGKDLAVSVAYTVLIVFLIKLKVVQPLTEYFTPKP